MEIKITKHKAFEFDINSHKEKDWINIQLKWDRKQDHAGIGFYFEIIGFYFEIIGFYFEIIGFYINIRFYDVRHWSYVKNEWEIYNDIN